MRGTPRFVFAFGIRRPGAMIPTVPSYLPVSTNVDLTDHGPEQVSSAYDADGVDRTLIRWMLRLSPAERLAHVQGVIDMVNTVRRPADGDR
jgi:hypothetical protein